jgi:hypothetical protein
MLAHRLPRHTHVTTEVIERPTVFLLKPVKQLSPGLISQSFEHCIHHRDNMQPFGCMSRSISIVQP